MKKLLLTATFAAAVAFVSAQSLTSKNGTPILPEAGDWSIGFDAAPLLNYVGNMFNNSTSNSVNMNYPSNNSMTIVGKMVKDETTAYRAKIALNFGSHTTNAATGGFSSSDSSTVASETTVSNMNIVLGAGLQKWRGKGRLKGYYGAELMVGFGGANDSTFTFLKSLTTSDLVGTTQTTENKGGSTFGLGVNGFIGVEYFFAPKISLSAEYNWGIAFSSTGASEVSTTSVTNNGGTNTITDKTTEGGKSSSFNVGVGNTVSPNVNNTSTGSGSIVLSFYF